MAQVSSASVQKRSTTRNNSDLTILNPATVNFSLANLPVGAASTTTTVGDFNGDGNIDLAIALSSPAIRDNLAIFLGSGNGSFGSAGSVASVDLNPVSLLTGDFDQDGNADLVTANFGSDTVSLLLGQGNGKFRTAQTFRVGSRPNSVVSGDFNRDGRLDLVTANSGSNSLSLLLGNSSGGFRSATTLQVRGIQPFGVAMGDFDRDGNLDLVSADSISGSISLLRGRGNGEFRDAEQFAVGGANPLTIVTGDFDGDNRLDVATGNSSANNRDISILFGDGRGRFPRGRVVAAGGGVESLVAQDVNGDDNLDLVGVLLNRPTVSVLLGDGSGVFTRGRSLTVRNDPNGLSVADFNKDGKPDWVTADGGSTNAVVGLNRTSFVVLRSSRQVGEVDGTQETQFGIETNLARGTLVIDTAPPTRVSVRNFQDVAGTQVNDQITGSNSRNELSGNRGADRLTGLAGDDRLSGGIGRDQLTGGDGRDRFIFDHGARFQSTDGQDQIRDFEKGRDKIVLDRDTFAALGRRVSFATVQTVTQAETSSALITYLRSNGRLFYNENGAALGFGTGGRFATLSNPRSANGNLAAADFAIQ